jgi:hypothetical protein
MNLRSKESYKHKKAKEVLADWLSSDYKVQVEKEFKNYGYPFRPDISVYTEGQLQAFYEVVHTSEVHGKTLARMEYYCMVNNIELFLYEVQAEYILTQCEKPEKIIPYFTFNLPYKVGL